MKVFIRIISDIKVSDLSNVQQQAASFMRDRVPNIKDSKLASGVQEDKLFKYMFVNENAPITTTQVNAERVSDDEAAKDIKFKLIETIQAFSGPLEGGRLTSTKKAYGIENWAKAKENLDWD